MFLLLVFIIGAFFAYFRRRKKIYCCGVFDLCHEGHLELLRKASTYGDLIVGVLDDETVQSYKRSPVMTLDERSRFISLLPYVKMVIDRAPLYTTKEFMDLYSIDKVIVGEEYFFPPYKYYEDPVNLGKYIVIPRHEGISTSDLIERIKKA